MFAVRSLSKEAGVLSNTKNMKPINETYARPALHAPLKFLQSMYFSNFVASKLNVWNSNGRHRLEEFLAKMGFSLEQCKQKYPFMSCQLRKRLRDQIEKYAEDYGLQDVFYGEPCRSSVVLQRRKTDWTLLVYCILSTNLTVSFKYSARYP